MANTKIPDDEKFEKQEFDLFKALSAIDRKDYGYYDRLSAEQKKGFVPFMMIKWLSSVTGSYDLQNYYLRSLNLKANKHMFDYMISTREHFHPKLQWLMLCAASPGLGSLRHEWIPQIKEKVYQLKEPATLTTINSYFEKVYNKSDKKTVKELSKLYVKEQNRKLYLAEKYTEMKFDDIEILNKLITDDEIARYEQESGNE